MEARGCDSAQSSSSASQLTRSRSRSQKLSWTCKPSCGQALCCHPAFISPSPPLITPSIMPDSYVPNMPGMFLSQGICACWSVLSPAIFPVLFSRVPSKVKRKKVLSTCYVPSSIIFLIYLFLLKYIVEQSVQGRSYWEGDIGAKT